jgi:hypothetical protein
MGPSGGIGGVRSARRSLRRVESSDPAYADLVCSSGFELGSPLAGRIRVGTGAGGRAIAKNRLVVMNDYANDVHALELFPASR